MLVFFNASRGASRCRNSRTSMDLLVSCVCGFFGAFMSITHWLISKILNESSMCANRQGVFKAEKTKADVFRFINFLRFC